MKTHRMIAIAGLVLAAAMSLPAAASVEDAGVGIEQSFSVDLASLAIHPETSKGMAGEPCMSMQQLEGAIDMTVRAKVRCTSKSLNPHQMPDGTTGMAASLRFAAVQATDGKRTSSSRSTRSTT